MGQMIPDLIPVFAIMTVLLWSFGSARKVRLKFIKVLTLYFEWNS